MTTKTAIVTLLCLGAIASLLGVCQAHSAWGGGAVLVLWGLLLRALYLLDSERLRADASAHNVVAAAGTLSKTVGERDAARKEVAYLRRVLDPIRNERDSLLAQRDEIQSYLDKARQSMGHLRDELERASR